MYNHPLMRIRYIVPLAGLFISPFAAIAADDARTWTNNDGKTVKGVLLRSTETTVTIRVGTRDFTLKLDTLSKADQEYVKSYNEAQRNAELYKFEMVEEKAKSDKNPASRTLKITLDKSDDKCLMVTIYWVGMGEGKDKIGTYAIMTYVRPHDGKITAKMEFDITNPEAAYHVEYGHDYFGYQILFEDDKGNVLSRYESTEGLSKYTHQ